MQYMRMVTNIKRNSCRLLYNDISFSKEGRRRKLFCFINLVTNVVKSIDVKGNLCIFCLQKNKKAGYLVR